MVAYTYNPTIQEAEDYKFEASLSNIVRSCFKKTR